MKIYTGTGDKGQTFLFSGERVEKTNQLIEAYGGLDEVSSLLGMAAAESLQPDVKHRVIVLQRLIYRLCADLATLPGKRQIERMGAAEISMLERGMDEMAEALPPLREFILPGGTRGAAVLQTARAVMRRAEREAVRAAAEFPINPDALVVINRLSDYLFLLACYENHLAGVAELPSKAAE